LNFKNFIMKLLIRFLVILFSLSGIVSCNESDPVTVSPDANVAFKAVLNGSSEVPPNASTGMGDATLIYNNNTKMFSLTLTYNGVVATRGHVHKGAVGVSGDPVFAFSDLTSPIYYTSVKLDATQEADLKANLYYINLHSDAYPEGEIRGQLIKQVTGGSGGPY
jgi:hypothetical protein